ncbi:MAG: hypothetical protein V2A78_04010 [bacterium]
MKVKGVKKGLRNSEPFLIKGVNLKLSGRKDGSFQSGDGLFFKGEKCFEGFNLKVSRNGTEVPPGKVGNFSLTGSLAELSSFFPGAGLSIIRQQFIPPEADALLLEYHFINMREMEEAVELELEFYLDGHSEEIVFDEKKIFFVFHPVKDLTLVLQPPGRLPDFSAEREKARFRCSLFLSPFGQKVLHLFFGLGKTREEAECACAFLAEKHPEEIRKALGVSG